MENLHSLFTEATYIKRLNVEDVLDDGVLYPASGAFIDMRGFYRGVFVLMAGAQAHANVMQVQQATAVDGTPKDITGAVATLVADKTSVIEFGSDQMDMNNDYRYVTIENTGGDTGDYGAILFLGFGHKEPVTQPSDYAASVALVG